MLSKPGDLQHQSHPEETEEELREQQTEMLPMSLSVKQEPPDLTEEQRPEEQEQLFEQVRDTWSSRRAVRERRCVCVALLWLSVHSTYSVCVCVCVCVSSRPFYWSSRGSISSETTRRPWRRPVHRSVSQNTVLCPEPSHLLSPPRSSARRSSLPCHVLPQVRHTCPLVTSKERDHKDERSS